MRPACGVCRSTEHVEHPASLRKGSGERPTTPRPAFPVATHPLTPSLARDVPRVDAATADVERLARFLWNKNVHRAETYASTWLGLRHSEQERYRDHARAMVRDFDELEEILADLLDKGGRF